MTWDFFDLPAELATRVGQLHPVFTESPSPRIGAHLHFEDDHGSQVIWFDWWDRIDETLARSGLEQPFYFPTRDDEYFNDEDQSWEIHARFAGSDVLILVTNYPHDASPIDELQNPTDGLRTSFVRVDVEECRRSWEEAVQIAKDRTST